MASEDVLFESYQKTSAPAWGAGKEPINFCQQFTRQQFVAALARGAVRRGQGKQRFFPLVSESLSESRLGDAHPSFCCDRGQTLQSKRYVRSGRRRRGAMQRGIVG
eukprot:3719523-Pyramimonas_sp.AAC.1